MSRVQRDRFTNLAGLKPQQAARMEPHRWNKRISIAAQLAKLRIGPAFLARGYE